MEIGNLQLFLYFIVYISELIIQINLLEDFKKNNIDKNNRKMRKYHINMLKKIKKYYILYKKNRKEECNFEVNKYAYTV